MWAIFIFASVSFYHTSLFTFSKIDMSSWVTLTGGNPFQKIAVAMVLVAAFGCLLVEMPRLQPSTRWPELSLPAIALVFGGFGYAAHFSAVTGQWLIDAGSHLAFFVVVIGLLILIPRAERVEVPRIVHLILSCLILLSAIVGFYEISTGRAWATYTRADGLVVVRASGLLFNPNLLGGWLGLAFLFLLRAPNASSSLYVWWHRAVKTMIGFGLFLSGSRGATICLALSAIVAVAVNWRDAWKVVRQYLFVAVGFLIIFAGSLSVHNNAFHTLALRWLDGPLALNTVLPSTLSQKLTKLNGGLANVETENLEIAVTGRFSGDLRDNGFLAALDRGGPLAVASLVIIWLAVVAFVTRASMECSGPTRASMWALLSYLLAWSIQARAFQVYPIWVFMGIGVAILLRDCTSTLLGGHKRVATS
ncbi:hypothetical protein VRZ08_08780 [Rhodopseudomonas sp. G2_2311]|uniref:hypothetical protein n=1 Tax=Rhodopseudomonas sp. G2_2311 TaxID=3114287 RepID=UPI0039C75311